MEDMRTRNRRSLCCALFAVALIYLFMASGLGLDLFSHSAHDSYTLQAMRWREGHMALGQDYPWLELAIYEGEYYVSFPPFPTIPMWLLTFAFGADTPSMLVNFLLYLASALTAFCTARALGRAPEESAVWTVGLVCGCNLLEISLYGGVWNIAQGMAFCLTMLCVNGLVRMGEKRRWRFIAPVCIACAVGCRPFQAVYVPVVLLCLYRTERAQRPQERWLDTLVRCIPCVIVPGLIAIAYGAYNFIRFDNVFEFGHNYLPEFTREGNAQFSLGHVAQNWANINRLPTMGENFRLNFPAAFGFAFYLANPLYLIVAVRLLEALLRRVMRGERSLLQAEDGCLLLCAAVHFFLLLLHRTFGGWQFGTRYLIDLIPMLYLFVLRRGRGIRLGEGMLLIFAICFNVYGSVVFHLIGS